MESKIIAIIIGIIVLGSIFIISYRAAPEKKVLHIIKKAPDFELLNQDNETISSDQLLGKVKVMSFIYTSCEMPNMCPRTTKNFRRLQESLGEELGGRTVLILVSFDPERDTLGMLKKYGELYGADFSNWHFLGGDEEAIEKILDEYEIIAERQDDETFRHSMIALLIDRDNNVRKMYLMNKWEPEGIRKDIVTLLGESDEA
ncbi:MAG: SCO family protein [Candidatus Undinarchaeales archaeon]|jgi:protein SCO1/2|nr:SCO family protein [Candidatus Undinarchaeales archaeon]MDP7491911.1 SCO family protein [Candidatus Undinarchaeales archaeon]